MREMTLESAEDLVRHIIAGRKRWGRLYEPTEVNLHDILDALVFLFEHEGSTVTDLRDSLKRSQQELGAAKAREARQRKINEELRNEVEEERYKPSPDDGR